MYEWRLTSVLFVATFILTGLALILFVLKIKESKPEEAVFQCFFILGIAWIAKGIHDIAAKNDLTGGIFSIFLGICYMLVSLARKYKWFKK